VSERYGARHKWMRKRAIRMLLTGELSKMCPRCGDWLLSGQLEGTWAEIQALELDHKDGSDTQYLGLSHRSCNRRAAGRGGR